MVFLVIGATYTENDRFSCVCKVVVKTGVGRSGEQSQDAVFVRRCSAPVMSVLLLKLPVKLLYRKECSLYVLMKK